MDQQAPSAQKPTPRDILAEHDRLQQLIGRLDETRQLDTFVPLLEDLEGLLRQHFEHEEEPHGLLEDISSHAPQNLDSLEEILDEHPEIIAELQVLIGQAKSDDVSPTDVFGGYRRLKERLLDHERRENQLFMDSFYLDIGDCD
jgi:hypothetical protein